MDKMGTEKMEHRSLPASELEVRETKLGLVNRGLAADTRGPYAMGPTDERLEPGLFEKSLAASPDVVYWWGHGQNGQRPLARTKSGTLILRETDEGLFFEASLDADDPDAQALTRSIKRGDVDGASFAFVARADGWSEQPNGRQLRTIREADLDGGDVSAVFRPANPAAFVAARSRGRGTIFIPEYLPRARQKLAQLRAGMPSEPVDVRGAGRLLADLEIGKDGLVRRDRERAMLRRAGR